MYVPNDTMMTQLHCVKSVTLLAKHVSTEHLRVVHYADLTQIGKLILIMNASVLKVITRLEPSLVMPVITLAQVVLQIQKHHVLPARIPQIVNFKMEGSVAVNKVIMITESIRTVLLAITLVKIAADNIHPNVFSVSLWIKDSYFQIDVTAMMVIMITVFKHVKIAIRLAKPALESEKAHVVVVIPLNLGLYP